MPHLSHSLAVIASLVGRPSAQWAGSDGLLHETRALGPGWCTYTMCDERHPATVRWGHGRGKITFGCADVQVERVLVKLRTADQTEGGFSPPSSITYQHSLTALPFGCLRLYRDDHSGGGGCESSGDGKANGSDQAGRNNVSTTFTPSASNHSHSLRPCGTLPPHDRPLMFVLQS
jgi:hypothetical protein